jgi:hypothetical protein
MVDGSAKLEGLLLDVGPYFFDGLFHAIAAHLIDVELSFMVPLDHLAPIHLAFLLGLFIQS